MDLAFDSVTSSIPSVEPSFLELQGGLHGNVLWLGLAMAVWGAEMWRRGQSSSGSVSADASVGVGRKRSLWPWLPEVGGLVACAALVLFLHRRGDGQSGAQDAETQQAKEELRRLWPVLGIADSLLGIQAMLRLVLLLSATLRPGGGALLAGEPAVFLLGAGICRVMLELTECYCLEGPLSGAIHMGFEVAALPLLAMLSGVGTQDRPLAVVPTAAALLAAGWVAARHGLPLSEDSHLNSMFTLVHMLELFMAGSILARTLSSTAQGGDGATSFASFAHVLLPLQQALAWYFLLFAFEGFVQLGPQLVLLQFIGGVQACLLLWAGIIHFAFGAELSEQDQACC